MDETNRKTYLQKEYEICEMIVEQNERAIWTTASIFFTASIGAIAFVASKDLHDKTSLLFVGLVGISTIFVLIGWYRAFLRWRQFQHLAYYRMMQIEEEMGYFIIRFGHYLDNIIGLQTTYEDNKKPDANLFLSVRSTFAPQWTRYKRSSAFKLIIISIIIMWFALVIREMILL